MDQNQLLLIIFVLNIFLVLLDATVGYHLAPKLLRIAGGDKTEQDGDDSPVLGNIRWMLSALVALYMFFNCMGYFRGESGILMIVAAVIAIDLVLQIFISRRFGNDRGEEQ